MLWNICSCSSVSVPVGAVDPLRAQTDFHSSFLGGGSGSSLRPMPSKDMSDPGFSSGLLTVGFAGAGAAGASPASGPGRLRLSALRLTKLSGPKHTSKRRFSWMYLVTEPCRPFSCRPPSDVKPWTSTRSPSLKAGAALSSVASFPVDFACDRQEPLRDRERELLLLLPLLLLRDRVPPCSAGRSVSSPAAAATWPRSNSTFLRLSGFRLTTLSLMKPSSKRPVASINCFTIPF
mmetsp:Transcript_97705/g.276439  ORF Transcript_97705/g.276439 Transcript_97705/m.276439 type:complete len:234 (+) Transcript_97705:545-1246(+)